jgi:hypothetical protein
VSADPQLSLTTAAPPASGPPSFATDDHIADVLRRAAAELWAHEQHAVATECADLARLLDPSGEDESEAGR